MRDSFFLIVSQSPSDNRSFPNIVEVSDCSLIMSGSVEISIIRQSIMDGVPDYRLLLDEAVSFIHNQQVLVARLLILDFLL